MEKNILFFYQKRKIYLAVGCAMDSSIERKLSALPRSIEPIFMEE
jgi:hypothetical protein